MPVLDVSELNTILAVLGGFTLLYGIISVNIKCKWFLGEALPAVVVGALLGPLTAKFIAPGDWGSGEGEHQIGSISLGICRVVIGVQLVIVGFQLPAKFQLIRWKEMAICLGPLMTIMWLCTSACVMATIPDLTFLAALVIGSCFTCTDPILSQAIAKGPFADRYVPLYLREIISSEAGANDGFGFPFLMLATFIIRYEEFTASPESGEHKKAGRLMTGEPAGGHHGAKLFKREEVSRQGGGLDMALGQWGLECILYIVLMSVVYGVLLGWMARKGLKYALHKRWVDSESYLLFPAALGLFCLGTCGLVGTDDLLACFVAGNALNWDGEYLKESERRNDEVNSCVDVLLNFGGFMYIGAVVPWKEMHLPDETGLTIGRLMGLGILVLFLRRIPGVFLMYKALPEVVRNWKDALFMGYFGPIGIGAVFYVEHAKHLFPEKGSHHLDRDPEVRQLVNTMAPVVYFIVVFSIVVHGLSIPVLNLFYQWKGVEPLDNADKNFDDISLKEAYFSGGSRRNRFSRQHSPVIPPGAFADPFAHPTGLMKKEALTNPQRAVQRPTRPDSMFAPPDPSAPQRGVTFSPHVTFPSTNPQGKGVGGSENKPEESKPPRPKSGITFFSDPNWSSRRASSFSFRSTHENYQRMPEDQV